MYIRTKTLIFLMILTLFGGVAMGKAQTATQQPDSTAIPPDTLQQSAFMVSTSGEIELLEINIEAVIEKPRVAILPKRVEPELGEMEFINRSFENELKQAPTKPMVMDNRLFVPKKIEDLKQKLLRSKERLTSKKKKD